MSESKIQRLLPQLCMRLIITPGFDLAEPYVPLGYELRSYQPGDELPWADLLNRGEFGQRFNAQKVSEYMEIPERRAGSRIVVKDGNLLASTFATMQEEADNLSSLDYVVSHPDYRGLGLGRIVCESVVKYCLDIGRNDVILHTDDWRIPALGLYLSIGFVPNLLCHRDVHVQGPKDPENDDLMKRKASILERWTTVRKKLSERDSLN